LLPLTAIGLAGFAVLAILWAPRYGVRGVSTAFSLSNLLFFAGSLAFLGWRLVRSVLPALAYLAAGGGLLYLVGPGIIGGHPPLVRVILGAVLISVAWIGWTSLHPTTRRLALGLLRTLRGAAR
jgi:hypothetical protein